jgi:hypothetical protein
MAQKGDLDPTTSTNGRIVNAQKNQFLNHVYQKEMEYVKPFTMTREMKESMRQTERIKKREQRNDNLMGYSLEELERRQRTLENELNGLDRYDTNQHHLSLVFHYTCLF